MDSFLFKLALFFTKNIISGCAGKLIYLQNGKSVSLMRASACVFWCLERFTYRFINNPKDMTIFSNPLYHTKASLSILEKFCPDTYEILSSIDPNALTYAAKLIEQLFIENKTDDDVKLLVIAIIVSNNRPVFIRALLCSLLNSVAKFISETKGKDKQIEPIIDNVVSRLNVRLLLLNTEKLTSFIEPLINK
jgi:hypothetical protein